jgi:hypothetical protein
MGEYIQGYFWTTEGYKKRRCMYGSFPCTSSALSLTHIHTFSLIVLSRKGNYKNGVESRRCNEGEAAAATTAAAISAPAEANAVQQRKSKQVQKKQLQS